MFSTGLFLLIKISLIKTILTFPLGNESSILFDQRQNGKYNIHLSIKDVSIIEIGGNDFEDYSDSDDYYYDDTMLTIKPWGMFTKPTSTTTAKPILSTASPSIIYVTPIKNVTSGNESTINIQGLHSNNTTTEHSILLLNTSMQMENLLTHQIKIVKNRTDHNQHESKGSLLEYVNDFGHVKDIYSKFKPSQRNPFDFVHRRKIQKPESRIIHFRPFIKNISNSRNGKKYGNDCKNVSDKSICQIRKRMNSLLMGRLLNWFKKRLPEDDQLYDSETINK